MRLTGPGRLPFAAMSDGPRITNPLLLVRFGLGGVLMGLANLVPGISGGTMLLAAGVYRRFVAAVARVTTCRWSLDAIVTLAVIVAGAGAAILLGAGVVKELVHEHRWVMYSLFLGLTLGGVPLLWSLVRPITPAALIGAGFGVAFMVLLFIAQSSGGSAETTGGGWWLHLIAGLAAGAAMVLPGLSGSYVLLILGEYLIVLGAVEGVKAAAQDGGSFAEPMAVIVPVAIGAIIGVIVISNAVKWALEHARKATLGVLLGLLLGAVLGLWPFKAARAPEVGEVVRGQIVTETTVATIKPEHWPTEGFTPTGGQWASAMALVVIGFACSVGIGLIGGEDDPDATPVGPK